MPFLMEGRKREIKKEVTSTIEKIFACICRAMFDHLSLSFSVSVSVSHPPLHSCTIDNCFYIMSVIFGIPGILILAGKFLFFFLRFWIFFFQMNLTSLNFPLLSLVQLHKMSLYSFCVGLIKCIHLSKHF